MKVARITQTVIQQLPRGQSAWAGDLHGLYVRKQMTDKGTYAIAYRWHRRQRFWVVGDTQKLTPHEAYKKARIALLKIANGVPPGGERETARAVETVGSSQEHKEWLETANSINKENHGVVYFVRIGAAVKIGISRQFYGRLQSFLGSTAESVLTLAIFPGGRQLEQQLHGLFQEHRIRNEFFEIEPVLDFLDIAEEAGSLETAISTYRARMFVPHENEESEKEIELCR